MTFETAKDLLGRPDEWPNLSEDDLTQLASLGSWVAALTDDEGVEESFGALYAYIVENHLRDSWSRAHARNPESGRTFRGLQAVAEGGQ
jgi:hypothetical protein